MAADRGVQAAQQGLAERLARGSGITALGFALDRGLFLAMYLIAAQLIVPADAGQLASGQLLIGMGFVFAEAGMQAAIIHWQQDVDDAASTAVASTLITGLLLTLGGLATAPLVGTIFDSAKVGEVAAASSGLLLCTSLAIVPTALLQRQFNFIRRITVDPLSTLLGLIVTVTLCALGMGVWGLLLGQYALYGSRALLAWLLLDWRPQRARMSWATWRELAGYSRHVLGAEVIRRLTMQFPNLLLGRWVGQGPLGQFSYGLRIAAAPIEAWLAVANYGLLPAFARMQSQRERMRRAFLEALAVLCTVGLPLSLVFAVSGDQLALALFGPEWRGAGVVMMTMAGLGLGQMLNSIASETFKGTGNPQLLARMNVLQAVLTVGLMSAGVALLDNDLAAVGATISVAALATGGYGLRLAMGLVGASVGALVRDVRGLFAAAGLALLAAHAAERFLFAADPSRATALAELLAGTALLFAVYGLGVRVCARTHYARIAWAIGRMLRRRQ